MADVRGLDRNLALEAVRVAEAAAIACSERMGRGNERAADRAAVDATGATGAWMLKGVDRTPAGITAQSLVSRSKTGTVRIVEAAHGRARKSMIEGRARWPA